MKKLLALILALAASLAHAQMTTKEAQEDAWAKAAKAKAANDQAVAAQRAAEAAKKTPPPTKTETHIYDGKGGKGYNISK
jgi:Ni/Co efflux regulator RcnB